jgi:hypothetical protein
MLSALVKMTGLCDHRRRPGAQQRPVAHEPRLALLGHPVGAPRQRCVLQTPPRRERREFRDAAGRGQDAPGRGRDAPETRDAAGTRKKRRQRPPRDRTHDHERRPRDRTQTRGTRETRERRSPDAGRRPRRRPDAARRGRDAPDAAKTRLPRRAGDAGGPGGDCPGT